MPHFEVEPDIETICFVFKAKENFKVRRISEKLRHYEDMPIDQKPTDFSNLQNKLTSQHKKPLDVM